MNVSSLSRDNGLSSVTGLAPSTVSQPSQPKWAKTTTIDLTKDEISSIDEKIKAKLKMGSINMRQPPSIQENASASEGSKTSSNLKLNLSKLQTFGHKKMPI